MFVLVQMHRRKSGLLRDPRGVAGLAAVASGSDVIDELERLASATNRQLTRILQASLYFLDRSCLVVVKLQTGSAKARP